MIGIDTSCQHPNIPTSQHPRSPMAPKHMRRTSRTDHAGRVIHTRMGEEFVKIKDRNTNKFIWKCIGVVPPKPKRRLRCYNPFSQGNNNPDVIDPYANGCSCGSPECNFCKWHLPQDLYVEYLELYKVYFEDYYDL